MQTPVNKNATPAAARLLQYLSETAGQKLITGQHTQTKPMEELSYIAGVTGRMPKLVGFELLACSPNINERDAGEECLAEVYQNRGTVAAALSLAQAKDIIVTLSFHWFSPIGGRDKSFYAKNTDFDARRVLIEGTPEREAFYRDMSVIAAELEKFKAAGIPVLWRPFHESDGEWFWWGAKGPEIARELYKLMFDYYVNVRHLDNLLWVWNCRLKEGWPGDEYVDVVSVDVYLPEHTRSDYAEYYTALTSATTHNKVAALAEVGCLPDMDMWAKSRVPWAYYMAWSKEFCIGEQYNSVEQLKKMYSSEAAVTLEK